MLLAGYGAYGLPYPASFSSNRLSLLDRGVTVAIAHIRGGGEMGKRWHDDGRMMNKRNTFTDFVAAADFLARSRYTAADRLIIEGGSAGGLLIGVVLNLRPDCASAAILRVPFVDAINTMLDESLPLTVGEFEEWGNPKIREQYEYMKTYCPYTNLAARRYPALLVKTSLNDSQVMYWEPAKYVARLRAIGSAAGPPIFKGNMEGGHGGGPGRQWLPPAGALGDPGTPPRAGGRSAMTTSPSSPSTTRSSSRGCPRSCGPVRYQRLPTSPPRTAEENSRRRSLPLFSTTFARPCPRRLSPTWSRRPPSAAATTPASSPSASKR